MAGSTLRTQQITSILTMIVMLVFVLMMQKSCSSGTAHFFDGLDGRSAQPRDAGP